MASGRAPLRQQIRESERRIRDARAQNPAALRLLRMEPSAERLPLNLFDLHGRPDTKPVPLRVTKNRHRYGRDRAATKRMMRDMQARMTKFKSFRLQQAEASANGNPAAPVTTAQILGARTGRLGAKSSDAVKRITEKFFVETVPVCRYGDVNRLGQFDLITPRAPRYAASQVGGEKGTAPHRRGKGLRGRSRVRRSRRKDCGPIPPEVLQAARAVCDNTEEKRARVYAVSRKFEASKAQGHDMLTHVLHRQRYERPRAYLDKFAALLSINSADGIKSSGRSKLALMRTLAEYRDMHAKAQSLKVFRPVLTHITKKKEVTDDHKALLRILKRIIQRGQQLTTTNFFAVMSQLAAEAKHEEWSLRLEDTIRVLRKELMVPYTQYIQFLKARGLPTPAMSLRHFQYLGNRRYLARVAGSPTGTHASQLRSLWATVSTNEANGGAEAARADERSKSVAAALHSMGAASGGRPVSGTAVPGRGHARGNSGPSHSTTGKSEDARSTSSAAAATTAASVASTQGTRAMPVVGVGRRSAKSDASRAAAPTSPKGTGGGLGSSGGNVGMLGVFHTIVGRTSPAALDVQRRGIASPVDAVLAASGMVVAGRVSPLRSPSTVAAPSP